MSEMGLLGALIVRPADGSRTAYGAGTGTDYDQEYLYLLTEADPGCPLPDGARALRSLHQ